MQTITYLYRNLYCGHTVCCWLGSVERVELLWLASSWNQVISVYHTVTYKQTCVNMKWVKHNPGVPEIEELMGSQGESRL